MTIKELIKKDLIAGIIFNMLVWVYDNIVDPLFVGETKGVTIFKTITLLIFIYMVIMARVTTVTDIFYFGMFMVFMVYGLIALFDKLDED